MTLIRALPAIWMWLCHQAQEAAIAVSRAGLVAILTKMDALDAA